MLHPWGRAGFGWWNTLYSMVNIPADCESGPVQMPYAGPEAFVRQKFADKPHFQIKESLLLL